MYAVPTKPMINFYVTSEGMHVRLKNFFYGINFRPLKRCLIRLSERAHCQKNSDNQNFHGAASFGARTKIGRSSDCGVQLKICFFKPDTSSGVGAATGSDGF